MLERQELTYVCIYLKQIDCQFFASNHLFILSRPVVTFLTLQAKAVEFVSRAKKSNPQQTCMQAYHNYK